MSNPTKLVSQFSGSLAYTDAAGSGNWTGVNPIRYDDGLWIEEATTNLYSTPYASNLFTYAHLTISSPTIAITHPVTGHAITAAKRITVSTSPGTQSYIGLSGVITPVAAGTDLTYQIVIAASPEMAGRTLTVYMQERTDAGALTNMGGSNVSVTIVGGVQIITITREILVATSNRIYLYCELPIAHQTIGSTCDVTAVQLESKSYATSFAEAAMGAGYSNSPAPHSRAASSASIATANHLDPSSGAIAVRLTPTIETGLEEIWGECGTKGAGTDHLRWGRDASKHPFVEWSSDDGSYQRLTSVETADAGIEHFVLIGHNGTDVFIKAAGGARESGTRDAVEGSFGAGDLVLKASVGGNVVGSLATFNRMLTDAEIYTVEHTEHWSMGMLGNEMVRRIRAQFELRPAY